MPITQQKLGNTLQGLIPRGQLGCTACSFIPWEWLKGACTRFTHILTKTKPVDLQSYSLKETRSLKQGLSVKMPEGCCYTSVLRDQ